jgi:hypothetical protein
VAGGCFVRIKMVITNEQDLRDLEDVIDDLRERAEDAPWWELDKLCDKLESVRENLTPVEAGKMKR